MSAQKKLYVTSLLQANNCSHMNYLKRSYEPLPPSESILSGLLLEKAVQLYLTEKMSAHEAAAAASKEYNLNESIQNFVTLTLLNLPPELVKANEVYFSLPAENTIQGINIAGYIDILAGDNIYELKYTQKYINEPAKSHVFQLQHYMYLLDKDYATIIYACNTRRPGVISFKVSKWSERKYLSLLQALSLRINENAPLGLIHDWQCEYCSFRHVCEYYNEQNEITLSHEARLS